MKKRPAVNLTLTIIYDALQLFDKISFKLYSREYKRVHLLTAGKINSCTHLEFV